MTSSKGTRREILKNTNKRKNKKKRWMNGFHGVPSASVVLLRSSSNLVRVPILLPRIGDTGDEGEKNRQSWRLWGSVIFSGCRGHVCWNNWDIEVFQAGVIVVLWLRKRCFAIQIMKRNSRYSHNRPPFITRVEY